MRGSQRKTLDRSPGVLSIGRRAVKTGGAGLLAIFEVRRGSELGTLGRTACSQAVLFLSRFAKRPLWDVDLAEDDVFVFGRETSGLPETILNPDDPRSVRLPTTDQVRSLNLATTVGAVMYEHRRQLAMAARRLGEGLS